MDWDWVKWIRSDQRRRQRDGALSLGVLPKKVSQLSFWLQTDAKTVHIPPMHRCERIHSYSFAFNLNICLLGTRRRRRRCRVSFIFFLALRLLLVAISSDRWPKKLKKRADWMRSPREFVWDFCKSLMSNSNNNNNKEKNKNKTERETENILQVSRYPLCFISDCHLSLSLSPSFASYISPSSLSLCCFVCQCGCCCCFITAFWRAFAMLL